ncbi:MAG TPA: hypothetical protein GX012_01755, partial [Acholeplasma sp.]|nr:hypothetical protein [Acholeplasma sp.]
FINANNKFLLIIEFNPFSSKSNETVSEPINIEKIIGKHNPTTSFITTFLSGNILFLVLMNPIMKITVRAKIIV